MKTLQRFSFPLLWALLLGVGFLSFPVEAVAQKPTLVGHLRNELQNKDPMRQHLALLDIISLANCPESCTIALRSIPAQQIRIENETGAGGVVDLNALAPDLLKSYRTGPADGHRLLALSALLYIGNEKALEQLVGDDPSQSKRVNQATQRRLAAYYLEAYPELRKRAMRTGEITIEEIDRARALRVKAQKKAMKNEKGSSLE